MEDRVRLLLEMLGQAKPMDGVTEKDTYSSAAWKGYDNAKRVVVEWSQMTTTPAHDATALPLAEESSCT